VNHGDQASDTSEEEHYTFATASRRERAPRSPVIINGTSHLLLLDSASNSTIISRERSQQLRNIKLQRTHRKIYPFGQKKPLHLDGFFTAQLSLPDSNKRVTEDIYVTSSNNTEKILSCHASQELGLIKFAKQVEISTFSSFLQQASTEKFPAPINKSGQVWTKSNKLSAPVNKLGPPGAKKKKSKQTTTQQPTELLIDRPCQYNIIPLQGQQDPGSKSGPTILKQPSSFQQAVDVPFQKKKGEGEPDPPDPDRHQLRDEDNKQHPSAQNHP